MVFIETKVKHSVKKLRKHASILLLFSISRQKNDWKKNASFFYCQQCCDEWRTVCTKAKPISFLLLIAVNPCEQTVDCGDVLSFTIKFILLKLLELLAKFCKTAVNVTTPLALGIWTNPKTLLNFARHSVCTVLAKKLNDALNCVTWAISVHLLGV